MATGVRPNPPPCCSVTRYCEHAANYFFNHLAAAGRNFFGSNGINSTTFVSGHHQPLVHPRVHPAQEEKIGLQLLRMKASHVGLKMAALVKHFLPKGVCLSVEGEKKQFIGCLTEF